MITLSCEINKVPFTAILDSSANCNVISKSLVNGVGLKIDNNDISDAEIYNPISKLDVVGGIREIDVSILSKDHKWERVKVTDIFVINSPELESVLILGQPWFQENAMKVDFSNKTLTFFD